MLLVYLFFEIRINNVAHTNVSELPPVLGIIIHMHLVVAAL
jgi:hypothetical protein